MKNMVEHIQNCTFDIEMYILIEFLSDNRFKIRSNAHKDDI